MSSRQDPEGHPAAEPHVEQASEPHAEPAPVPDADELERTATPGTLRRAPRYRAFVAAGIVVGALAAVLVVTFVPDAGGPGGTADPAGVGRGVVLFFVTLATCLLGALLGALVAVLLDRRSRRG